MIKVRYILFSVISFLGILTSYSQEQLDTAAVATEGQTHEINIEEAYNQAENTNIIYADNSNIIAESDTIYAEDLAIETLAPIDWKPNPNRAVWLATIIPGAGQIYNRSYWKLPIVYGGFMGCIFAVTWNNRLYQDYKTAYRDILLDANYNETDPSKSYVAILPVGYTVERMGGKSNYTSVLNKAQNSYRRYRDISIVATVAVYALSIIDAFVDAQLYDFDISSDLSMTIEPQIQYDYFNNRSTDLNIAIRF